jgi:hypothetical protein
MQPKLQRLFEHSLKRINAQIEAAKQRELTQKPKRAKKAANKEN